MTGTNDTDVAEIKAKLDIIIKLLATNAISDGKSVKDNAVTLSRSGMSSKEIADLLGTTRNTISVALSTAKKPKKPKTKKKRG